MGKIMDLFDALFNRRSIRKYTNKNISESDINKILRAAMYAPSAMNNQAWHFVVIDDKKIIEEIYKIFQQEMLKTANTLILICGDLNLEKNINYIEQNCSAATQNILLAAHGLGIGSCWIGVYPTNESISSMKKLFNLPDYVIPISLVSLGYPAEEPSAEERFKIEKVHFNNW